MICAIAFLKLRSARAFYACEVRFYTQKKYLQFFKNMNLGFNEPQLEIIFVDLQFSDYFAGFFVALEGNYMAVTKFRK